MSPRERLLAARADNEGTCALMGALRGRFEAIADRQPVRALSAWQLFQTPPELAARVVAHVRPGSRVLEPSAGLGRLLDALPEGCETVAVEPDAELCGELYKREGLQLLQRDFLKVSPDELPPFDHVAMNPPFHMRADISHISHALGFLKAGGTLSAVCMDTRHRREALLPLCYDWEELPRGSFRSEGTNVPTMLIHIQK